jgi:hypothetical protein
VRDHGAAAAIGAYEPALLQGAVGGRDGGRADLELGREVADGGEPFGRGETLLDDGSLDRRGDRRRPRASLESVC